MRIVHPRVHVHVRTHTLVAPSRLLLRSSLPSSSLFPPSRCVAQVERETLLQERAREAEGFKRQWEALKRAAGARERELLALRRHAKELIRNRSELEQFFLDALQQAKEEVRRERQLQYQEAQRKHKLFLADLARGGAAGMRLPNIRAVAGAAVGDPRLQPPAPPSQQVELKDLSAEQRHNLLRQLFAKITHVTTAASTPLPPHSFNFRPAALAGPGAHNVATRSKD